MSQRPPFWRRMLHGWLEIAGHFGEVQTLVLLGIVYLFVIGPSSLVTRLSGSDLLAKRKLREPGSAWRETDPERGGLERAKHPF